MPEELKRKEHSKKKEFTYIFENYYKRVYNYIYCQVSPHYTAEDLTSLIFGKIMVKTDIYSERKSPFKVWLFAITRNVINDYFRSLKKNKLFSIDSIKEELKKGTGLLTTFFN